MNFVPKGAQKDVLALEPQGHTVVLGTAGSGKTSMALLLASKWSNLRNQPKVLVVTFNRALVAYMNAIQSFSSGVVVENFHRFALGYLKSRGKNTDYCVIGDDGKENIIKNIVEEKKASFPNESTFTRPVSVFVEEIQFLERFGVRSLGQYVEMERIGRADTYISRDNRHFFYEVYEEYRQRREEAGYSYDWDDIALYVLDELGKDESPRRYTHVIVDEGQDFSPVMLRALISAVPKDGSFTFFGDVAQQIYGSALSWKASGIETRKVWRFEKNYRNPVEIAEFAQDITKHPEWEVETEDFVKPEFEIPAAGVKPTLIKYSDAQAELNGMVKLLKNKGGRNVIIVKNRSKVTLCLRKLIDSGIAAAEIKKESNSNIDDGIYVTTFHSSKGLEFDSVYIPFLNEDEYPDRELLQNSETKAKVYSNALKLFYVAVTRAKQTVVMSYSSELTHLFPADSKNYVMRQA